MPSKGSKRAASQAKLRQQKRHGRGTAQTFDAGPSESSRPTTAVAETEEAKAPARAATTSTAPARRQRRRPGDAAALAYSYLGREIKRIGATTVVIFALLAVASFFMGS